MMDWRTQTALDLVRARAPRYVPAVALEAVEALLARYAQGKYATPRWQSRTEEEHAAACGRHLAGFLAGKPDHESGESHAIHLAARALQLVAVEIGVTEPEPGVDELDALVGLFVARRDRYVAWYGPDEARWPFAAWERLQSVTAEIERLRCELKRGVTCR